MNVVWFRIVFAGLMALGCGPVFANERAENFRLTDQNGRSHELYYLADHAAVVLFSFAADCATSREAASGLAAMRDALGESAPPVLGVNALPGDDRAAVTAALGEVAMPVLMDPSQSIGRSLGLQVTGEALVLSPKADWAVTYRGAADAEAIQAALAGNAPQPPAATGRAIAYADYSQVSYARDIVPILESKCVSCHRDGGLGPFAMSDYRKVLGWGDMIRETVRTKRMPPWHADTGVGEFLHSRALSAEEEAKLLAWVEQGAPKDGGEDPLPAIAAKAAPQGWQLGEPDHVVRLPETQDIPAEGIVDYRYIPVAVGVEEDKWVRALEVRTDNPAVVHHALIFINYPREYRHKQPKPNKGLRGYFASYLPGAQIAPLPEDAGIFLPKGAVLTFQMHYSVTGKPEKERTEIGFYFHDRQPARVVRVEAGHYNDFLIPPNAQDHPTHCHYEFKQDAEILGLSPHMHFRGSRFRFALKEGEAQERTLLNVPFYEFDWQPMYFLKEPVKVAAGTRMLCDGAFDNSHFNRKNPNPAQYVPFGEQSFQEMFIGYIQMATPLDPADFEPRELEESQRIGRGVPITPENIVGMKFRIVEKLKVEFRPEGKVVTLQGDPFGSYSFVTPGRIRTKSFFGEIDLYVVGDELYFEGEPTTRLG